jgi:lambda family phage portal protein
MSGGDIDIDALIGSPPAVVAPLPAAGGENAQGAFDGADRWNQDFGLWAPPLRSADADLFPDKPTLDARARDVLRNDAYVQGGGTLHKDNIVGAQFLLNARPVSSQLFGKQDDVWEAEFQEEVETLWELWADSPDNWPDASRMNNFTGLIRLAVGVTLAGGEMLATAEWDRQGTSEFNTAIQMIECDRLSTDPNSRLDQSVRNGVRRNSFGAPIAYQIRTEHPQDVNYTFKLPEWKEIAIRKPWGRLQVIHLLERQRPDQTRGVPEMAAALREMRMGHSLRDINLQHAVTQALYAATITSDLPSETLFAQLGGNEFTADQVQQAMTNIAEGFLGSINRYVGKAKGLTIDGVRIPHLYPGTKLELQSPGANSTQGTAFEESLLRYIAATLGVSYEQLSRDYTKTNYSSARAAMTETWKFMQARKKAIADKFATIIYRLWLEEAAGSGRFTTLPEKKFDALCYSRIPGQRFGVLNSKFDALSKCDWIGASRGQIDELKETQAAVARVESGLSTYEDELARLGKDWRKVFRQLKREQALRDQLDLVFVNEVAKATAATANQNSDNQKEAA